MFDARLLSKEYVLHAIFHFSRTIWLIEPHAILSFHFLAGKPFLQGFDEHISEEAGFVDNSTLPIGSPARSSPHSDNGERFSRKVFVGGLPPDIDEGKMSLHL